MDLQGHDFSYCRDPIFSDSKDLMIVFSESRDPIRSLKHLKKSSAININKMVCQSSYYLALQLHVIRVRFIFDYKLQANTTLWGVVFVGDAF